MNMPNDWRGITDTSPPALSLTESGAGRGVGRRPAEIVGERPAGVGDDPYVQHLPGALFSLPRWSYSRGRSSSGWRRSADRDDDAVAVDLAVDGRPRHAERFRRLGLVAAGVQQRLHDRVPLQRLQRAEQAAADRPAFGRQVRRLDRADPLVPHDLPDDLP